MKHRYWLYLLTFLPLLLAQAQPAAPDRVPASPAPVLATADEEAIGKVAAIWQTAYNGGDSKKVAALYTEDGCYLSSHVLAQGRPAIEAYFQRGIVAGGHIDFIKPLAVHAQGDLGYTAGLYQATNAGVTVDGRVLLILQKVNGKWLIAAHATAVRDQP